MKKPFKLLFVCLGNICRSPAAEGVMRRLVAERGLESVIEIDSAGTYGGHAGDLPDRRMRVHARQRGYELTHRSRRVTGADLERFDLIVGMDSCNVSDLRAMAATLDEVEKIVPMGRFIRRFPPTTMSPTHTMRAARALSWCSTCSRTPAKRCSTT